MKFIVALSSIALMSVSSVSPCLAANQSNRSLQSQSIPTTATTIQVERSSNEAYIQVAQTDRWTNQVREQLLKAAIAAGFGGYQMTYDPFIGDLGRGGESDVTLNVRSGVSYAIVGVCDNDCRDIDLRLYDDNGNLIVSDIQRDDTPVVKFTPRWNARFTVRVIMANCSNAPCRYGIGFFNK